MNIIKMPGKENHVEEMVVGLPRAFLYYRYKVLWETFFKELGIRTVVSPDTNLEIMKKRGRPGSFGNVHGHENIHGPCRGS